MLSERVRSSNIFAFVSSHQTQNQRHNLLHSIKRIYPDTKNIASNDKSLGTVVQHQRHQTVVFSQLQDNKSDIQKAHKAILHKQYDIDIENKPMDQLFQKKFPSQRASQKVLSTRIESNQKRLALNQPIQKKQDLIQIHSQSIALNQRISVDQITSPNKQKQCHSIKDEKVFIEESQTFIDDYMDSRFGNKGISKSMLQKSVQSLPLYFTAVLGVAFQPNMAQAYTLTNSINQKSVFEIFGGNVLNKLNDQIVYSSVTSYGSHGAMCPNHCACCQGVQSIHQQICGNSHGSPLSVETQELVKKALQEHSNPLEYPYLQPVFNIQDNGLFDFWSQQMGLLMQTGPEKLWSEFFNMYMTHYDVISWYINLFEFTVAILVGIPLSFLLAFIVDYCRVIIKKQPLILKYFQMQLDSFLSTPESQQIQSEVQIVSMNIQNKTSQNVKVSNNSNE